MVAKSNKELAEVAERLRKANMVAEYSATSRQLYLGNHKQRKEIYRLPPSKQWFKKVQTFKLQVVVHLQNVNEPPPCRNSMIRSPGVELLSANEYSETTTKDSAADPYSAEVATGLSSPHVLVELRAKDYSNALLSRSRY